MLINSGGVTYFLNANLETANMMYSKTENVLIHLMTIFTFMSARNLGNYILLCTSLGNIFLILFKSCLKLK